MNNKYKTVSFIKSDFLDKSFTLPMGSKCCHSVDCGPNFVLVFEIPYPTAYEVGYSLIIRTAYPGVDLEMLVPLWFKCVGSYNDESDNPRLVFIKEDIMT